MTREEAINNLESLYNEVYNEDSDGYVYAEAIDMAIESLQKDIERHKMVVRASERHLNIVRCKDCRWWQNDYAGTWCCRVSGVRFTNADDFCSHGERQCNYFGEGK